MSNCNRDMSDIYRISGYFGVGKFWRICSEIGIEKFGACEIGGFPNMRQNYNASNITVPLFLNCICTFYCISMSPDEKIL